MPELIALALFVVALFVIETVYVRRHQKTISEHVQELFRSFPAIGVIVGFVMGFFACHFFSGPI